jgi:hypothetical protein
MTDDYQCTFVDNGAECVFGKNHRVNYHHLEDGRDVQIVKEPELSAFPESALNIARELTLDEAERMARADYPTITNSTLPRHDQESEMTPSEPDLGDDMLREEAEYDLFWAEDHD